MRSCPLLRVENCLRFKNPRCEGKRWNWKICNETLLSGAKTDSCLPKVAATNPGRCALRIPCCSSSLPLSTTQKLLLDMLVAVACSADVSWMAVGFKHCRKWQVSNGPFSFVIVPKRRPGNFPIFLLNSLLKGKIAWAPTLKTALKKTKKKPPNKCSYVGALKKHWRLQSLKPDRP